MPEHLVPEHLDADTVAAFSARSLSAQERSRVFEHLADCDRCREWIALNAAFNPKAKSKPEIPNWCLVAAAGIACAFFAGWLMSAHPAGDPITTGPALPEAWRRVRLAPEFAPPLPPNQVSIKTTVGEKWIPLEPLWDRRSFSSVEKAAPASNF